MTRTLRASAALTLLALVSACATPRQRVDTIAPSAVVNSAATHEADEPCGCGQAASLRERAICLYQRGFDLNTQRRLSEARTCFDLSAAIYSVPPTVHEQLSVRMRTGDFVGAHRILAAQSRVDQNVLEQMSPDLIREVRSRFATLQVVPDGPVPSDVVISLDASRISAESELDEITPGAHVLTVRGLRRDTRVYRLELLGGEVHRQAIEIGAQHAIPVYERWWFWTGVTGLLAGGVALFDCLETREVLCQPTPIHNGSGSPPL